MCIYMSHMSHLYPIFRFGPTEPTCQERPDIGVLITQLDRGIFVTKQNIHPAPRHGGVWEWENGKMRKQQNYVL